MVYFPQSQPAVPQPTLFPPAWGSVTQNSPMFAPYGSGSPGIPSYAMPNIQAPAPAAPVTQGLYDQLGSNLGNAPMNLGENGNLGMLPGAADAATTGAGGLRGAFGGLRNALKTPEGYGPLAVGLAGQLLRDNTQQGTAPHIAGTALATGGTTAGLAGLGVAGLGAAGAANLPALPIEAGALAGGVSGSLINHYLGSGSGTDLGPFHWHHAEAPAQSFMGNNNAGDKLIGVAMDQFKQGNITNQDFNTIMHQTQLNKQLGMDDKTLNSSIQQMIVAAVSNGQQASQQAALDAKNHHRELLEQAALAHLMGPAMADMDKSNQALAASERATRGQLTGGMAPISDLIANQTVAQGKRATATTMNAVLTLPQIQSLIQAIQDQNTAQQAANYYAARQTQAPSSSSSTGSLQQQLATTPTGAGGASGIPGG